MLYNIVINDVIIQVDQEQSLADAADVQLCIRHLYNEKNNFDSFQIVETFCVKAIAVTQWRQLT